MPRSTYCACHKKTGARHPKCRTCSTESSSCPKSKMTIVSQNETAPEKVSDVLHLSCKKDVPDLKCPGCPASHEMEIFPKTSQNLALPFALACAVKMHMGILKAILFENLQDKCRAPRTAPLFCASLHSRHGHGHLTRAILRKNLQEKGRRSDGAP